MISDPTGASAWSRHLSAAVGAIRRARQLSVVEVADRMGLARRSYANFEEGRGRLNVERIMTFAQVTDSDPYAILFSVLIGAPELALRAVDNKLATAFTILLQEFSAEVGEDITLIETSAAIAAFSGAFKSLTEAAAVRRANSSQAWLAERAAKLAPPGKGPKKP